MESRRHSGRSRRDARPAPSSSASGPPVAPLATVDTPPDIESFREWDLAPEVLAALDKSGISSPTPIQRLAIGPALDGYDVIAKAETGTGKTLAFGAPLITRIDAGRKTVLALILTPTRELAQQVAGVLQDLGAARGIKVALIVGGEEMEPQILALRAGAQIVVGTPGRVLDLHNRKLMSFPWTEFAILDEADEMLEIGFLPDVEKILSRLPQERQTMLFSATFPAPLLKLAREYTRNPVEVATAKGVKASDTIKQSFMYVGEEDRHLALLRLIERSADDDVFLVFCDRRTDVDVLYRKLGRAPFPIKALHGGYDQPARFRVMDAFRAREVKALVATDVAARGLDVAHVTHVVNYAAPRDVSDYTHRIGRTGRAGREGEAITFVVPSEIGRWRRVVAAATWDIPEVPPPGPRGYRDRQDQGPSNDRGRPPAAPDREAPSHEDRSSDRNRGFETRRAPEADHRDSDRPVRRSESDDRRREARPESRDVRPAEYDDRSPRREPAAERPQRRLPDAATDRPARRNPEPEFDRPARRAPEPEFDRPARRAPEPEFDRPARRAPDPESDRPARRAPKPENDRPARSAPEPERPAARRSSGERSPRREPASDRAPRRDADYERPTTRDLPRPDDRPVRREPDEYDRPAARPSVRRDADVGRRPHPDDVPPPARESRAEPPRAEDDAEERFNRRLRGYETRRPEPPDWSASRAAPESASYDDDESPIAPPPPPTESEIPARRPRRRPGRR